MTENNKSVDSLKTVEESTSAQSTKVTEGNDTTTASFEKNESKDATSVTMPSKPNNKLKSGIIYKRSELLADGYNFSRLMINRDINDNALKKKEASIKNYGVVSGSLIVMARQCLDEGLKVIDYDGNAINYDTPDLDSYIVIIDGQHRHEAVMNLNKDSEVQYEDYFHLPLEQNDNTKVTDILRESNVTTNPWKGTDYLTQILNQPNDQKMTEMLGWVKNTTKECGDTAAWLWASFDINHKHSKSNLIDASKKTESLKRLAETDNFQYGKAVYEKAFNVFGKGTTKLKVTPTWMIEKWNLLLNTVSKPDATKQLISFLDFIQKPCNEDTVKVIQTLKREKNRSKDEQIIEKLNELYAQFEAKQQ